MLKDYIGSDEMMVLVGKYGYTKATLPNGTALAKGVMITLVITLVVTLASSLWWAIVLGLIFGLIRTSPL